MSSGIIYDEDYIKKLDERNNFLSQENEIIIFNYQNIYNEFINFQTIYLEKHNENLKKTEIFDKICEQLNQANNNIDNLVLKNQICENKISELVERNTKIEMDNETFNLEIQSLRNENNILNESNLFYKNFIANINNS